MKLLPKDIEVAQTMRAMDDTTWQFNRLIDHEPNGLIRINLC